MMPSLDAFADIIRHPDSEINLAAAALHIAGIVEPVDDPRRAMSRLDDEADWLRVRIDPEADLEQSVRRFAHVLAVDRGLHGNTHNYYDPRNSCINVVLATGAGIPISLSVIYLEIAWRIGLPLTGVGMPGHFLVKATRDSAELFVDPFHGGAIMSRADCAERLRLTAGAAIVLEPHHLATITRKQIVSRMLTNLKHIYLQAATPDLRRALMTVEHLLVISPWSLDEIRDRGTILTLLGDLDAAARDLETYVQYARDAPDTQAVRQQLNSLRRQLPPLS